MIFRFSDVRYRDIIEIDELTINKGVTILLGPSGGGKTTLLRMLNKMISPTKGQIFFMGESLAKIESVQLRRKVMMLSQNPVVFPGTVRDNLAIAFEFQDKIKPDDDALDDMLSRIQLNKKLDDGVINLSGGEKQRLALGRLLLLEPEVYLFDEPSSSLDDDTEDLIIRMLSMHVEKQGQSIVMVTHSKRIAEKYADVILEISEGKVLRSVKNERDN
ncbi:MAG: ATP-binding cassette domain-containing protein [Tissierellales bacterium]|nr:ATP-binding cassette domain-containing protein [Tissierellales bacterium]MBN2827935.1 ATP-binding cassette domain-containing protein [Tissierellales bacterium]